MTPEELESENQKLKATLIDCRAEYLLFLDENPNAFAWDFDELSREAQDRYRKDARESLEIEEPVIAIQLREAEEQITILKEIAKRGRTDLLMLKKAQEDIILISRKLAILEHEKEFLEDAIRQLKEEHPEIDWEK